MNMLPNSNFFQNLLGVNVFVVLTIQNTNAVPMNILSAAGGVAVTTLAAGETVTAAFSVKAGHNLFSAVAGEFQFLSIDYL